LPILYLSSNTILIIPKEAEEERRQYSICMMWVMSASRQWKLHWFKLIEFPGAFTEWVEEQEGGRQDDLQGIGREFSPLHSQIPLISARAPDHLH